MRVFGAIVVVLAVGFLAVMAFFYFRDGSLQSAGAKVDEGLSKIDKTTEPLQKSLGDVGAGVGKTIENATDGDDDT